MIARPDNLTVRPNPTTAVSMDPLSDVPKAVRLTGTVFLSGHFTAPWRIGVEITADECARHFPGLRAQIIGYRVVVEGRMLVDVDSEILRKEHDLASADFDREPPPPCTIGERPPSVDR
jgi:hypothetical protein